MNYRKKFNAQCLSHLIPIVRLVNIIEIYDSLSLINLTIVLNYAFITVALELIKSIQSQFIDDKLQKFNEIVS